MSQDPGTDAATCCWRTSRATPGDDRLREARRVYIESEDADMEISFGEHPYSPVVLWQDFVDPEKHVRWQPLQTAVKNQPNQQGRLGAGASSHCAHGVGGDALREYLDWRPYSYFTNRFTLLGRGPHFFRSIETFEFIPPTPGRGSNTGFDSRIAGR